MIRGGRISSERKNHRSIAFNSRNALGSSSECNNVAATFAMSVNDPTPAISGNGAAIIPRPASSTELVSDDFPVFHWRVRLRNTHLCRKPASAGLAFDVR